MTEQGTPTDPLDSIGVTIRDFQGAGAGAGDRMELWGFEAYVAGLSFQRSDTGPGALWVTDAQSGSDSIVHVDLGVGDNTEFYRIADGATHASAYRLAWSVNWPPFRPDTSA